VPDSAAPCAPSSSVRCCRFRRSTAARERQLLTAAPWARAGATGATGREVVALLLAKSETWTLVTTVGRNAVTSLPEGSTASLLQAEASGRLVQQVVDMDALETQSALFAGADAVFCTLGTTRSIAGSAAEFKKVNLSYVDKAAEAAHSASVPHFALMTSQGARAGVWHSDLLAFHWLLYTHVKGAAENAVLARGFPRVSVFRPGLLARGNEYARPLGERLFAAVLTPTHVADVARAMIAAAERAPSAPVAVYENADIRQVADAARTPTT
jgi:oxidoreductase